MSFSFAEVERAINGIRSMLKMPANDRLQEEFDAGLHPNFLAYQKRQTGKDLVPVLERYLVGARSYLNQPSSYYDIFGAGRSVILVEVLETALTILKSKKANGLAARVEKLVTAVDFDVCDSTVCELVTAGRYAAVPGVKAIELLQEHPPKKTPDILIDINGVVSFIECKKASRVKDFSVATRKAVRNLLGEVISPFRHRGVSFLAEVVFSCDPSCVGQHSLADACEAALDDRTTVITEQFTVKAVLLPKCDDRQFLFPSPAFYWKRYGHRIRSEWFGLVPQLIGKAARWEKTPNPIRGGLSTWIDTVEWDSAIKWKIKAEDVVAKYQRFPFDGLFDAVTQINGMGVNSTVHLWLETDHFVGGRRDALLDFYRRLCSGPEQKIGWIVVNETLVDVSPKGRFDFIEHAHMISGPTATAPRPTVSGIFGLPDVTGSRPAEFGTGNRLPDIDED
jgi:hypothetical protein